MQTVEVVRNGRDPFRREEILGFIRDKVLRGEWAPGSRIPPRSWFETRFTASSLTVQNAFSILQNDRVLVANGRNGTRVHEKPPHLNKYGIVLYGEREEPGLLAQTVLKTAEELQKNEGWELESFFAISKPPEDEEYKRLLYAVKTRNIAGLFFITLPRNFNKTPILETPEIPRVCLAYQNKTGEKKLTGLVPLGGGYDQFIEHGLHYISQTHCRPALLLSDYEPAKQTASAQAIGKKFSIDIPTELIQVFPAHVASSVESVVRLLFSKNNRVLPDSLYVGDDNFLPYALKGLKDSLGEDAEKILVVSHGNYPLLHKTDFPVKYFMLDVPALLRQSIEIMQRIRAGEYIATTENIKIIESEENGK